LNQNPIFETASRSLKLKPLFTLSSLMTCFCQQLSVLVLPHFFATFFDYTTQLITSNLNGSKRTLQQAAGNLLGKDSIYLIRSLTPRHTKHCRTAELTGHALAIAVQ
jgi:hypothetical protein